MKIKFEGIAEEILVKCGIEICFEGELFAVEECRDLYTACGEVEIDCEEYELTITAVEKCGLITLTGKATTERCGCRENILFYAEGTLERGRCCGYIFKGVAFAEGKHFEICTKVHFERDRERC